MIFDLFHSVSDPQVGGKKIGARQAYQQFLSQAVLAESLGMDTLWLAESHFSSEIQKRTSVATIPNFHGEVGLNCDSFQWFHEIAKRTHRIGLGTGIHNIVGGSGGPLASADRVNTLHFLNNHIWDRPRELRIGVAAGRFPYQNTPFGLVPRNEIERDLWPVLRRFAFIEALEIFLRLLSGETLSSEKVEPLYLEEAHLTPDLAAMKTKYRFPLPVPRRWVFEWMKLVPEIKTREHLHIVLGSADPLALNVGLKYWDLDLFNLSFTPPAEIEKLHQNMERRAVEAKRTWRRDRLPRTVLVFVDPNASRAKALADQVLDSYIEAMRGTAAVPDKKVLWERALVGDAVQVREQLSPDNPRRFHCDDRLMLWFEFNQLEGAQVEAQMRYFFEEVVGKL